MFTHPHHETLAQPLKLNSQLTLKNRILMAPMTRNMATNVDWIPTEEMADYYARRADAGLIITEGILIDQYAGTYTNVPGLFSSKQVAGWRRVVDKVHARGGLIFAQIWHVGRVSHPQFCGGNKPISPSATKMTGNVSRSPGLTHDWSRAASIEEIEELVHLYAQAANNAKQAGFDGIEIHGANGYLIDQFLHYHTNLRTDEYGGSPANMARFALRVVDACADIFGYERVALRLSPAAYLFEIIGEYRDQAVFKYLLTELNKFKQKLAYVHVGSFDDKISYPTLDNMTMSDFLRAHYEGVVVGCGSYTPELANAKIKNKCFDLVAIGRPFIANHDLIHRIFSGAPIRPYDAMTLTTVLDPSVVSEERASAPSRVISP